MRKILFFLAISVIAAVPLAAQNTDIESLSGLQFNFGNPGARSLGMGGAFLGLADDASAAEANPAGLTILRKPEISIEGRNYLEQQIFTTSGTFPDIQRTAFSHYSKRVELGFASLVYPVRKFTFGVYYHEPLRNTGGGQVIPTRSQLTGAVETTVPNFFLPKNGTPVTRAECEDLRRRQNDFFACLEYNVIPFISILNVRERTFGFAGAYKIGNFSVGGTVRYQRFHDEALTLRFDMDPTTFALIGFDSFAVQASSDIRLRSDTVKDQHDVTFAGGVKWTPNDKFSVGGVYKQGAKFATPTFAANTDTKFQFVKVADTTFHIPDIYGVGVSYRPIPVLTVNADAVHVTYSNLVDNFTSVNEDVRALGKVFKANDVTELHLGAEYFFAVKTPFALRGGVWRDPAHSIEFRGPLTSGAAVASALLYPKGTSQTHLSVGAGMAWPRFQIDAAYDRSEHYKVGSISMVARF
jgi:long-chain fatty acid transport protein